MGQTRIVLTVLGSGTAALEIDRGPSGYALRIADSLCLLDGGTGSLQRALKAGISYRDVDYIFYTHLHPDHTMDLVPFLFATKYTPGFVRTKPLRICGPVGFTEFYEKLLDVFGSGMAEVDYEITISELAETTIEFPAFNVESALMQHTEHAIGYRFASGGRVFVYSGDTDFCSGIINLASAADVLVVECSFPDDKKMANHLTPSEAGRIASDAGVGRLILTHLYPPFDAHEILTSARQQFSGPVEIANDLMQVTI